MIEIKIEGLDIVAALADLVHPGPVMPQIAGIMHDAVMQNCRRWRRPMQAPTAR